MSEWPNWCVLQGIEPVPVAPAAVADFVKTIAPLGIERVWEILQEISRSHYTIGLADPTLSRNVVFAVNDISQIKPPRSWPKKEKARFLQLPYDLQKLVARREAERDKWLHQLQNKAAQERKQNGIHQDAAA